MPHSKYNDFFLKFANKDEVHASPYKMNLKNYRFLIRVKHVPHYQTINSNKISFVNKGKACASP